jgi:thioredoxin-related protein
MTMRYAAIFTILFSTVIALGASEQGEKIRWYSFEEAVELSRKNPRKILVDIYTDWCGFCKKMDAETFSNPDVARFINKHFYPVKLNSETNDTIEFQGHKFVNDGQGRRSPHQLSVALLQGQVSYPSIVYINEQLELLTAVPGFRTPEQIEPLLRYIGEDHYLRQSWDKYQEEFTGSFR